jgi:RNA polymerase sigma factor (sigma-70 family)
VTPVESGLLERCARGDSGAWEEFLARFRGVLEETARRTLFRVIGSAPEDDLEAIVEATLLGLIKEDHAALRSFSGRSSLAGYLQAITTKIALNHLRSERRKGWLRFRPLDSVPETPAREASGEDLQRLEKLVPRDRLILKLFHLDGAGYREIASLLGVSVNAVSPALIRARDRLRALLAPGR